MNVKDTLENSRSFACATYLLQADMAKVGRVPIDDYKDYKLTITYAK